MCAARLRLHCQESIRRGSLRSWDHAQLVHAQWLHAAGLGIHMHIKRVATDVNIADLPSRKDRFVCMPCYVVSAFTIDWGLCLIQDFELLRACGMIQIEPVFRDVYGLASTWEVLQERWAL